MSRRNQVFRLRPPNRTARYSWHKRQSSETTGSIRKPNNPAAISGSLKSGLDALSDGDTKRARAIRNGMSKDSLDQHILAWAIAVSGAKGVPSVEIATAAHTLKGWPGLSGLRRHSERALYREAPSPKQIIAAFGNTQPETTEGAIALTRAYLATGKKKQAAKVIARGLEEQSSRQENREPDSQGVFPNC